MGIVNIPCDVSENIEKLKQRLLETLKMYEILSKDEDGNKDKNELKNTLKKTIENIENQMKKLMIHQKKRQQVLLEIEENKKEKESMYGWRGRGRGRGRGYR